MANPREIRRLAFQTLFQIDARGGADDIESLRQAMGDSEDFTVGEQDRAMKLALSAYSDRAAADAVMLELAPGWPVHRQAAVDRAILRLAHYEMTVAGINPKVVVNEAVELAKGFSTEKSPAFINGLLDKVLKRVIAGSSPGEPLPLTPDADEPAAPEAAVDAPAHPDLPPDESRQRPAPGTEVPTQGPG